MPLQGASFARRRAHPGSRARAHGTLGDLDVVELLQMGDGLTQHRIPGFEYVAKTCEIELDLSRQSSQQREAHRGQERLVEVMSRVCHGAAGERRWTS